MATRHAQRRRAALFAALAALMWLGSPPCAALPKVSPEEKPSADAFALALRSALDSVESWQAQVDSGRIVHQFGKKARGVVEGAVAEVGVAGPQLERALDGALQALFLQQLALLRRQVIGKYRRWSIGGRGLADVLGRADQLFAARARELVPPGRDWSFQAERRALRAALESELRQAGQVALERRRATQTLRATADVVGKLQKQMEQLGDKLRGMGAGSPWVLWTSYRLPGTPFQMSGRYQQGRANIQLNLSPNRDPANAEAGFVEGLTASNIGLSLNIGV